MIGFRTIRLGRSTIQGPADDMPTPLGYPALAAAQYDRAAAVKRELYKAFEAGCRAGLEEAVAIADCEQPKLGLDNPAPWLVSRTTIGDRIRALLASAAVLNDG